MQKFKNNVNLAWHVGNPDIQVTKKRNQVEKVTVHRFFTTDSKGFGFSMLEVAIKNSNNSILTKIF